MTDLRKLLPCPFCGGNAEFGVVPYERKYAGDDDCRINHDHGGEFIQCNNSDCSASTMLIFPTMADAKPLLIQKWNRRARIDGALADQVNTEPAVQVKWVKCADTLPLPHKDYWLCIEGGKFATIGRLNHQFNGDLYWCLENGNKSNDLPYAEVTHYAEIVRPELPSIIRAAKEGK